MNSSTFPNGTILQRQASGDIGWGKYNGVDKNISWDTLENLLRGTYGDFRYCGLTMCPTILKGQYLSLSFIARAGQFGHSLAFNANPTYGFGALITISDQPGDFSKVSPWSNDLGYLGRVGINSICYPIHTTKKNIAVLNDGQLYYLNMAGVNTDGSQSCAANADGSFPTTCDKVTAAYYTQQG